MGRCCDRSACGPQPSESETTAARVNRMAKAPKKVSTSKPKPRPTKKDGPGKRAVPAQPKKVLRKVGNPEPIAVTTDCLPLVETGKWCLFWRDAAGVLQALEQPTVDRALRGDPNTGPYWSA